MIKTAFSLVLLITSSSVSAQNTWYVPFAEAEKAIAIEEDMPKVIDSLKCVYNKRWSIGLLYGQRFITKTNFANAPDIITFTDFTSKRSFFGLEGGYFITSRFQISLAFDILSLPKEKDIKNVSFGGSGLQVEGSGSGGAMLNIGLGTKYFFNVADFTRLYAGLKLGRIKLVAEGGEGGFTPGQGQFQKTIRLTKTYNYGNALFGVTHRLSPGVMVDFNIGYLQASKSDSVGGILSPGGITSTLTLQFIIGKGNQVK